MLMTKPCFGFKALRPIIFPRNTRFPHFHLNIFQAQAQCAHAVNRLRRTMPAQQSAAQPQPPPLVKVALVGDSGVGKTSLMMRYVEGTFDETQLPTQGVNFMERTVSVQGHELTFSVWDIGGSHFESMLPLVCNDAAVVLLMFDLCRRESLDSIRKWHEKARSFNKHAVPFLVGCKWDQLALLPEEEQRHVEDMARRFAKAIRAPLIFCAPSVPINVTNVFKVTPPAPECTAPPLHRHAPSPTPPTPECRSS